jgi:hypothetical protein
MLENRGSAPRASCYRADGIEQLQHRLDTIAFHQFQRSRRDAELASAPLIVARNYRPIGKNTPIGIADITVPKWRLKSRGVTWHAKNGKDRLFFPSRELVDRNGACQFAVLAEFTDKDVKRGFQKGAVAAVRELGDRAFGGTP